MAGQRRRQQQQQQQARRKRSYVPLGAAAAATIKPKGAFRLFSNYRLFAIVGAVALVGGYGLSFASGGSVNAHGTSSGGNSVRGDGVRRESTAASGDASSAPARIVRQYAAPPPATIDQTRRYLAVFETDKGTIQVELLPQESPQAVNNFIFLARDGFYDGLSFHRVIPGFVAQAGDPTGTGLGGPGYDLPFEPSSVPFEPGVLAVAKPSEAATPNNGSQFFFALGRQPTLDGKSTVIGRVIQGREVLDLLAPREPQATRNAPSGDIIRSIVVIES